MADSDISLGLTGVPSGVLTPRTRDRGGNIRESVHSLSDSAGSFIDPATSQLQTTGNTALTSINGKLPTLVSGRLPIDGSGVTQPVSGSVSVSALPALPAGANAIGSVSVSNLPATQAVSGTVGVSALPALPAGSNAIGSVSVSNLPATQPVSGTVTANLGTIAGVATAANQTTANTSLASIDTKTPALVGGAVPVALGTVKAANTAATATDTALVVAISPNSVNANGRAAAAASAPVVLSNEDSANQSASATFHLVSAATTNATVVKASAGQLRGWYIYNSNAAARKVAFHDAATTPTAGASVKFSLVIPPSSGANLMAVGGVTFGTGIAITTTTGLADNDTTAVASTDLVINLWYV